MGIIGSCMKPHCWKTMSIFPTVLTLFYIFCLLWKKKHCLTSTHTLLTIVFSKYTYYLPTMPCGTLGPSTPSIWMPHGSPPLVQLDVDSIHSMWHMVASHAATLACWHHHDIILTSTIWMPHHPFFYNVHKTLELNNFCIRCLFDVKPMSLERSHWALHIDIVFSWNLRKSNFKCS